MDQVSMWLGKPKVLCRARPTPAAGMPSYVSMTRTATCFGPTSLAHQASTQATRFLSTRAECHGLDGRRFTLEIRSMMPDRTHFVKKAHGDVLEVTAVGNLAWRKDLSTGKLALMDPYVPAQIGHVRIHQG